MPFLRSIEVTNTGRRAVDEVVQLYLGDPVATVTQPVRQLKAFRRVTLAAGARKTLTFTLGEADLAFCHPDLHWAAETGDFVVTIGPDSERGSSVRFRLVNGP